MSLRSSLLCCALLLPVAAVRANDSMVDTTFAPAPADIAPGWRRTYVSGSGITDERIVAARRAPDGGYVLAGYKAGGAAGKLIFLAKFLPDGSYDATFGGTAATGNAGTGRVLKDAYLSSVTAMTIDTQGRIVVVGATPGSLGQSDFGVVRFNTNGTDDTSFAGDGGTGMAFDRDAAHGRVNDLPYGVATLADGSVFVAGVVDDSVGTTPITEVGLIKLKPDGSRDNAWANGNGTQVFCRAVLCRNVSSLAGLVLDVRNNRLSLGGTFRSAVGTGNDDWLLVSVELGGTQASYTDAYAVDYGGGNTAAVMQGLAVQADGKVVAAGYVLDANGRAHGAVLRRTAGGTALDTGFASGLYVDAMLDTRYADVAIDSAGNVVLSGGFGTGSYTGMVRRLLPNGVADASFNGGGGSVSFYSAKATSGATAISTWFGRLFLDAGRPVLAGESPDSSSALTDYDLVVMRLQGDRIFADGFQP